MTVTTEHYYTGNNSTTSYAYTFPYYKTSDIKVTWDGALKTESTHYNVSGTNIVFTSGNTPGNNVVIHIYRETDVDTSKATFAPGSSIRATDLNNQGTQLLYAAQEVQGQQLTTGEIKDGAITSAKILDGTIATADIADNAVTAAKLATNSIDATNLAANSVGASELANDAVDTAAIADDAVTSAKIATGAVIADGLASNAVTTAKIYNEAVETAKIDDGAVTTAKINNAAVTADKLGTDSVITAKILDANVTTNKIANDSVTADKLANSINAEITANTAKTTNATHTGEVTGATALTIANNAVVTARIADDAVTTAKIPDNAITTAKIADAELSTLAGMPSGTASILADSTALTSTTTELNLLDGKSVVTSVSGSSTDVQLPTAKAVNDQIVNTITDVGGFVPIANEVSFPNANPDPGDNAGTIVSIADAGGVVVNGSGVSTTGRTLGGATVTINGIDSSLNSSTIAAGKGMLVQTTSTLNTYTYHRLVVDEAGVASAQTLVSDFNERYRIGSSNPTSSLDDGDLFFNTSSNKMLVYNTTGSSWDEVQSVGNFYINTISSYSGTGGNSASFNGSAYRFVLSNAPTYAQQLIVSVNGVLQKPNAGTSQPSEGFAIDGSSIIFSAAPASGSDYFIVTIGAAVNIGAPSDNQVSTASLQNSSVTTAKIANDAVTADKIADSINTAIAANTAKVSLDADSVTGAKIADDAVGAEHIEVLDAALQFGDSVKAQFGAGNDLEVYHNGSHSYIDENGSGILAVRSNGTEVAIASVSGESMGRFINDGAVELYHNNFKSFETHADGITVYGPEAGGGQIKLFADEGDDNADKFDLLVTSDSRFLIRNYASGAWETHIECNANGAVELYYDNVKQFQTTSTGVFLPNSTSTLDLHDGGKIRLGTGSDLEIFHDGNDSFIKDVGVGGLYLCAHQFLVRNAAADEIQIQANENGAVKLYYDNAKRFETTSTGNTSTGNINVSAGHVYLDDNYKFKCGAGEDLNIYHNGTDSFIQNITGDLKLFVGTEQALIAKPNGAVEIYHNDNKKLNTSSTGIQIHAVEGGDASIELVADEGDDNADYWRTVASTDGSFYIQNYAGGAWETNLKATGNGSVELYHDHAKKFETYSSGVQVDGHCLPYSSDAYDLGGASNKWRNIWMENDLYIEDNGKATFGTGEDFLLWHDGTDSKIYNTTGAIYIQNADSNPNTIYIRGKAGEDGVKVIGNGSVELYYDNSKKAATDDSGVTFWGQIAPDGDGTRNCGNSVYKWLKLYSTSGTIGTSDRNEKNTILESDLGLSFVNKLKPVSYKWNNSNAGTETHYGLIAQDIEEAIESEGKTLQDFGAVEKPSNASMGLNYSELISPLIKAVQELSAEVETLKTKVAALEAK